MVCGAMLSQEVPYGVDGLRGVANRRFRVGVATHFGVPWQASPRSYSRSYLFSKIELDCCGGSTSSVPIARPLSALCSRWLTMQRLAEVAP